MASVELRERERHVVFHCDAVEYNMPP